ncbi:MAG: phage holin [Burkholderiales bacterium]|nr:phage holin [Burkholderiales bacterium]
MFKINWKVRVNNPFFWIGLIGVILTAMGVNPETFTSWSILIEQIKILFSNPYLLGTVIIAIIGVLIDPTTSGIKDSIKALSYNKPNKD